MRPEPVDERLWDELASASGEDLVTITIPTRRRGREVSQGAILLKNEIAAVANQLEESGWKPQQRDDRLSPLDSLLEDREFWEHQDLGLAIYVDDGGSFRAVALPSTVPESSYVLGVYLLRPLLSALVDLEVPVLALTRDEVGVFATTAGRARAVPTSLPTYGDVNWFVDRETQRQQHPDGGGGKQSRHGHEPSSGEGEDLARFLREVDAAVEGLGVGEPLIVLGDDTLVARYAEVAEREVTSPENSGISTGLSESSVAELSRPLIVEMERRRSESAREHAEEQIALGMGTTSLEEAVAAAFVGRISHLLIQPDTPPIWGRIDSRTLEVEVHGSRRPGDVDLLDRLVVWSRRHGATLSIDTGESGSPFMAVFRY